MWPRIIAIAISTVIGSAAVVDRVAVVIDKKIITESEVLDDLRLTQFINREPLDLSAKARRSAADHLVDQELIRRDLQNSGYRRPPASEADTLLRKFRQDHFNSVAAYRAALQKYGITEEELKQRLLWQVEVIGFTDLRFRALGPASSAQSADRAASESAASSVDQQLDAWLTQARKDSKISFKQEAFQ